MSENMVVGLLVGVAIVLVFTFAVLIFFSVIMYKSFLAIRDEMRRMTQGYEKVTEVVISLKEAVQFFHTEKIKEYLEMNKEQEIEEAISRAKESARK